MKETQNDLTKIAFSCNLMIFECTLCNHRFCKDYKSKLTGDICGLRFMSRTEYGRKQLATWHNATPSRNE